MKIIVDNTLAQNFFGIWLAPSLRSSIHAPEFLNVFDKMPLSPSLSFLPSLPLSLSLSLSIPASTLLLLTSVFFFHGRAQYALKLRAEWFRSISRSFIGSLPKLYLFFFFQTKERCSENWKVNNSKRIVPLNEPWFEIQWKPVDESKSR